MFRCAFHIIAVLSVLMTFLLFCGELPVNPILDPANVSVRLFLKDGGDPVVDKRTAREIGLELRLTNLLDSVYLTSGCCTVDTAFEADSAKIYDTVWINPFFDNEGQCILSVRVTMRDNTLKDKSATLSIHVLAEKPGISFIAGPQSFIATAGATDTLLFVTRTTGGAAVPPAYSFTTTPASDVTFFTVERTPLGDTARVIMTRQNAGAGTLSLIASTTYGNTVLADTASVAIVVKNSLAPSIVDAPKQVIAGKADTLVFAVDNSKRPDPLTISLTTKTPLDPAVFSIVPTGPDTVLIAISSTATAASADFGIITGNGTETDTAWYPVTIISQNDALWNTLELVRSTVEGTPLAVDLKPLLSAVNVQEVAISADIGNVSSDKIWNFTPPWGCAATVAATITATRGSASSALKITLNVAPGDVVKPVLTLVDQSLDGKKVSASQITIECEATDAGAGIGSVMLTCGTQTVPAILQHGAVYSGVITGLVHGAPAQITITATDASRAKNTASITVTVTRDSTALDAEAPAIVQLTGPKSGERVMEPTGTIGVSVTDNSGVDSVWWTLNGVFKAAVAGSNNSYTIGYTLSAFKENVIALYAKDKSSARNEGSSTITLNYNTKPATITLTAPAANATAVSKSATFKWSGGDDADGEGVTCTVRYGTTQANLGNSATVSGLTATATLDYATTYYWQVTAKSVSTAYPDEVQSSVGTFTTEGSLPTISADPQSQSVEEGKNVTFTVTAGGFGTLSYQWRLKGTAISGATGNSYTIPSVTTGMNNNTYDCVVKNEAGEVTSKAATLTVTAIPTFTVSFVTDGGTPKPADQPIQRGGKATKPTTDPARSGYRFTGWYELNATHEFYFTQTTITADLTIYAGWKKIYTVTYHKNNDENGSVPASAMCDSGTAVTVAGNTGNLSKTGYDFKGWTTTQNGSGTVITSIPAIAANTDLYPKWEMKAPTITTPITDKNCPVNDSVTFSVVATGADLSYAWQQNGVTIGNATGSSYTTTSLTLSDVAAARTYKCIVTNASGSKDCSAVLSVSTVNDIDGNVYHQVKIGTQVWLMENLKTTHYRDGTEIRLITDGTTWVENLTQAAYCWANFSISSKAYGAYYNWFAASSMNITPAGWRLPTEAEWTALFNLHTGEGCPYISEQTYWAQYYPCTNGTANNSTGFSAMGNGFIEPSGGSSAYINGFGSFAHWWASEEKTYHFGMNMGWDIEVGTTGGQMYGLGIRCIKE